MDLCKIGTVGDKVHIFSVNPKHEGKKYGDLDELAADFITGLKSLNEKPNKVLLYEGNNEVREYMAKRISEEGYTVLNRKANAPKKHPGMGMYVILLDYFLKRTSSQVILEAA